MEGIDSVRVGHLDYKVVAMRGAEADEIGHGVCNFHTCIIKIDTSQCFQRQVETLWHEVKHAVHKLADLTDSSTEEEYCMRAAPLEIAVLRDNPRLMELLAGWDNSCGSTNGVTHRQQSNLNGSPPEGVCGRSAGKGFNP